MAPTAAATVKMTVCITVLVRVSDSKDATCLERARGLRSSKDKKACTNKRTAKGKMTARSMAAQRLRICCGVPRAGSMVGAMVSRNMI
jgi:hypothetical protein